MKPKAIRLALAVAIGLGAAASGVSAKTLVFCSEGSPEGFNPSLYEAGTTFDASSRPIFNRLVEFKRGGTKIVPGLARKWEVSSDGLHYTFHLRKGVRFQSNKDFKPSRDFDADDVVYSFDRQLNKNNPMHNVSGGQYEYIGDMGLPDLISSVQKIDKYTVRFNLKRPEAPFLADMAMDFASIMSKEQADAMLKAGTPDLADQEPVGTGPFALVAYQKDAVIRYRANPHYWKGKAPIDNLVFAITPDASVRYQKLKANECQVMDYPNPADIAAMKKEADIKVMSQPGLNVGYLAFNTQKKPFDNVEVRRALNIAVNKKAIIKAVFQGAGTIAKNPIPPTMWSYNKHVKDYPYDPALAKKMLAKAGYPNGFNTDIWAMPVQRPYNPNARRMAELIQADWAKVGVNAKIVTYEWGEYLKRVRAGDHQTVLLGWTGDNGDPDNFLYTLLSCDAAKNGSSSRWCYKPFDDLLIKAKETSNIAVRTRLYEKAQVIFKKQAPWITIAHSVVYMPMRKNVVGYKMSPFGSHDFYGVNIR